MKASLPYFLTSLGYMTLSGRFCEAAVSSAHLLPHTGSEAVQWGLKQETIKVIAEVLRSAPCSPRLKPYCSLWQLKFHIIH